MATYSYPDGVSKIPYASYLQIKRYEYNSGLANAENASKLGTQGRIKNYNSAVGGAIGGLSQALFGQDPGSNSLSLGSTVNPTASQRRAFGLPVANNRGGAAPDTQQPIPVSNLTQEQWKKIADGGGVEITNPNGTKRRVTDYKEIKELIESASKTEQQSKGTTLDIVLPNEVQYSYGAEWNNTFRLGTLALLAGNTLQGLGQIAATAFAGALAGGASAAANQGTGAAQTPRQQIGAGAISGAIQGFNPFQINSPLGATGQGLTNLVGLAGLAPNENAVQFFQKMANREFTFTFEMFAPDDTTANQIEDIINIFFKQGMHPDDKVGLLGFPDVYEINPKFVSGNGVSSNHKLLPRTKLCALTNMRVNAAPANFFQTTFEGYIPIVTCEVTFKEITALTRQDLEAGL